MLLVWTRTKCFTESNCDSSWESNDFSVPFQAQCKEGFKQSSHTGTCSRMLFCNTCAWSLQQCGHSCSHAMNQPLLLVWKNTGLRAPRSLMFWPPRGRARMDPGSGARLMILCMKLWSRYASSCSYHHFDILWGYINHDTFPLCRWLNTMSELWLSLNQGNRSQLQELLQKEVLPLDAPRLTES